MQTEAPPRRSTAPRRSEASSLSTQTEAPQQRVAFAQTESIAPSVADTVMNVVESAQEKGTQRRLRNQRMAVEELGNTTRIPEAAMRAALEAQPQPRPAESKTRSSSPMIQYVGDEVMEEQKPEVDIQYSRAEMRRIRREQAFPQPYGTPKALNPMSASSADARGSSAALEYQRRLREEELLRLEHQHLVSQQLQAEQEEAKRGRSKTVSMETDAEKAKKRSTSDDTSKKGKKSKVGGLLEIEPMPMTRAQKQQEAKTRQQEEHKAEKKAEKKAKKESKTEYCSIADIEPPKQRKKKEEPKKRKKNMMKNLSKKKKSQCERS
jgi:IgA-specific serine endopeptidase